MDCKAFATKHPAFIDDTLPGIQMAAMRDHLTVCSRCARRDAEIRRALLLVRNIPPIEVSDGFQDRLRARLAAEASTPVAPVKTRVDAGFMKWALAAGLLVALVGVQRWPDRQSSTATITRLPAVYAETPVDAFGYGVGDESAPAYVASMSTGIPMWPALMLAEEGPLRFAGMQNVGWDASRPHD
jgi:hypothetical protein